MKVGLFSDLFYPYLLGGGENRYYQLARHLVASGDEVVVITSNLSGCPSHETLFDGKLHIHRLGFPPHPVTRRSILTIPGYFLSSVLNPRLVEECDILDLNTYASALAGKVVSGMKKKPFVVTVHDLFTGEWSSLKRNLVISIVGTLSEKLISLGPHTFIATSQATKAKMICRLGIEEKNINIISNAIQFELIRKLAQSIRKDSNRIVYVGRLVEYKGVEQILQIVLRLREQGLNVGADIVGDGSDRGRLVSLASKIGVSKFIRFWGFLKEYADVVRIMSSATVFVNPSLFEGFGMAGLEAMASGTPVVAYDLESYEEYAKNGVNCLLSTCFDFEDLLDNVKSVLLDPDIARDISERGIETAKQFSWKKMAEETRDIYSSLVR